MEQKVIGLLKLFFILTLLSLYGVYFCRPSFAKFFEKAIQITSKSVPLTSQDIPAITICPHRGFPAWKTTIPNPIGWSPYEELSGKNVSSDDLMKYINNNTFELNETLEHLGKENTTSAEVETIPIDNWPNDITYTFMGKCYTLNGTIIMETELIWKMIIKNNFWFLIFLHDPNFFILSENPKTIPRMKKNIMMKGLTKFFIETFRKVKLSTTSHPCNNDPDYSFTACVKNSVTRDIGCR